MRANVLMVGRRDNAELTKNNAASYVVVPSANVGASAVGWFGGLSKPMSCFHTQDSSQKAFSPPHVGNGAKLQDQCKKISVPRCNKKKQLKWTIKSRQAAAAKDL